MPDKTNLIKNTSLVVLLITTLLLSFLLFDAHKKHQIERLNLKSETEKNLEHLEQKFVDSLKYYQALEDATHAFFEKDYNKALILLQASDSLLKDSIWTYRLNHYITHKDSAQEAKHIMSLSNNNLRIKLQTTEQTLAEVEEKLLKERHLKDTLEIVMQNIRNRYELAVKKSQALEDTVALLKTSYGELKFANTKGQLVTYYGEVKNGKAHEYGIGVTEGISTYVGSWKNNLPQGKGKYRWDNGHVYQGDFNDGKREGFGVYSFDTGEKYVGEWKDDLRHGKGAFHSKDGSILFEGYWVKDRYDKQASVQR
ncbi:MAG: hypothetical protein JJT94_08245 [Bernardetiaceae bacterium]|nr:hypothetical protein [Bernardetiaceae bacterium]